MCRGRLSIVPLVAFTLIAGSAQAQTVGTFRWQLQPYCNVVTATVVLNGHVFTLDGFDDQCGTGPRAAVTGTAFPNPDGSVGIGLAIVTAPSGTPLHVDVALNLATLGGPWRDSAGDGGTFAFTPGASTGGAQRPVPLLAFPSGLSAGGRAIVQVASPINPSDAATRQYVDGVIPPPSQFTFLPGGGFQMTGSDSLLDALPDVALGGNRLAWLPGRGTLIAGRVDASAAIGNHSALFGFNTIASGNSAFAAGDRSKATEFGAVAMGRETVAAATGATAFGAHNGACGFFSVALGLRSATATAPTDVNKCGGTVHQGAFIFSSFGAATYFTTVRDSEFAARAIGGFRFRTNAAATTGCDLPPGTGAFACTSDVRQKRDFARLDGEQVLARVAGIPVTTWSFVDRPEVRHAGPMAQDFHAAFGLGENDTSIGYTDINGINMRAIQALEQRTRDLLDRVTALEAELRRLRAERREH